MKIIWPQNVMFERAELACQKEGERGDKMVVEPAADKTFIITIHDNQRIADCVVSLRDMLVLGELVMSIEKQQEFVDE